jgi:predicted pyridoxine 5'-phosphate oxidase superfamily flavin-nucleotide-binding protein
MNDVIAEPFHAGERAAQRRAGMEPRGAAIRDWMPDQHREFFAALPFVLAATSDEDGWPVATVLSGPPGFIASPAAWTLRIDALPDRNDPAARWFVPGASVGLLGIDLATRRRNRANGVLAMISGQSLVVAVEHSFGNCPQYIHVREAHAVPPSDAPAEQMDHLDASAREAIVAADTLFVATGAGEEGVDISHRGGKPGFVRVDGDVLTIPDFAGNRYFNTLGNLVLEPRAALLFPDFTTGDVLHVQGGVEIVWDVPEQEHLDGAERLWRVHVTHAWRRRGALPFHWDLRRLSPGVARTGTWHDA